MKNGAVNTKTVGWTVGKKSYFTTGAEMCASTEVFPVLRTMTLSQF